MFGQDSQRRPIGSLQRLRLNGGGGGSAESAMTTETATGKSTRRMSLTRHSSQYWRVTLDHPPLNIFGPESIPQLNEVVTALETDKQVKVVVFDSAVEGFFLTHYDFLAKIEDTTSLL